ncbi:hypothetical protein K239x_25390 [Planctomycetes bacterium K23_9]|uniref:Lnb N-terminal periplasmic domain-containing protein n=1 Tax=Stieleria marina TaxID=1930275 RepID=A0A517NU00_9BACT|nr:hypothetical protein K239x_25390 [Planctomycetes bacterium K23_9]
MLTYFVWSVGALYHLQFVPAPVGLLLAVGYFVGAIWLLRHLQDRSRWLACIAGSVLLVYLITLAQQPSNDRNWAIEQTRTPLVEIDDDHVSVRNVRNNTYRSEADFDVHYRDESFRLSELTDVWFVVQKFSALEGLAHTFLSFERASEVGPQFLGVSVEIRRERGETYSPIRGLYRNFEVIYILGDERDLIGSRTVMRPDDRVWMYRVNATPGEVQLLFSDIAKQINQLNRRPEFYHTLLRNCTNEIVSHTYELTPAPINWLDPRIVLPGFSGRFAYSQGLVGKEDQSWADLQTESRIDARAREAGLVPDFSMRIRNRDW